MDIIFSWPLHLRIVNKIGNPKWKLFMFPVKNNLKLVKYLTTFCQLMTGISFYYPGITTKCNIPLVIAKNICKVCWKYEEIKEDYLCGYQLKIYLIPLMEVTNKPTQPTTLIINNKYNLYLISIRVDLCCWWAFNISIDTIMVKR